MSVHRARPCDVRACPKSRVPVMSRACAAGLGRPCRPRLRYLREHAVVLALIRLLALIALPPALVTPSGEVELIATGANAACLRARRGHLLRGSASLTSGADLALQARGLNA
jgi:hypothetical protein